MADGISPNMLLTVTVPRLREPFGQVIQINFVCGTLDKLDNSFILLKIKWALLERMTRAGNTDWHGGTKGGVDKGPMVGLAHDM